MMTRARFLAVVFVALAGVLPAAEQYRMSFRNSSGWISLPDDFGKKNYFIALAKVGVEPLYFGGPRGMRFKVLKYHGDILTCEEVETKKTFDLELGKWVNFYELPP